MINFDKIIGKNFRGVVSISENGKSVYKKSFGYADLPNERPNKVDTKFGTASAGKAFVATGIMKLIKDNKLTLESCIGDLLDFNSKTISGEITVKQLLNHTSGIPDYFDESVMDEYAELWVDIPNYRIRTSTDLLPLFINKPMMYKPGEKFQYNNSGYVILGLIIEKVTGIKFDEYLSKIIFEPCGMKNTGYYELDRLPGNCANAYIYNEAKGDYYKLCGQAFWSFMSGEEDFYIEIIEPLGYKAKEKNEDFNIEYAKVINKFSREFLNTYFLEDGSIDWVKIVMLNSENKSKI